MRKLYTLSAACVLSAGLSACSQSPLLAPESPRFDGGYTYGSGNRTDSTTVVVSSTDTTTEDGTTTERGGHTGGSGN